MSELEVVVERCPGVDVHQAQLRVRSGSGDASRLGGGARDVADHDLGCAGSLALAG